MIFKSKQVNTDQKPYRNEDSAERLTAQEAEQDRATGWEVTFDPRPEFDHPVNRILAGVREDVNNSADLNHDTKATAEFWLSFSDDWDKDGLNATPDEIAHARRVLTRLAAWQRPATGTSSAIETREDT